MFIMCCVVAAIMFNMNRADCNYVKVCTVGVVCHNVCFCDHHPKLPHFIGGLCSQPLHGHRVVNIMSVFVFIIFTSGLSTLSFHL